MRTQAIRRSPTWFQLRACARWLSRALLDRTSPWLGESLAFALFLGGWAWCVLVVGGTLAWLCTGVPPWALVS